MSNMLSRVVTNPIGMMIVGSARNWLATKGAQVSSKLNQAVDVAVPFAAGAQTVLGTAAVVDNLVGAVSPAASQAIDRGPSPRRPGTGKLRRALPASAAAANRGFQSGANASQAELAKQNSAQHVQQTRVPESRTGRRCVRRRRR